MKMTSVENENEYIAFALKAAKWFEENPQGRTFAIDGLKPEEFLALRWGANEDCVVIVRLCEYFEPMNFQNIIKNES